MGTFLQRGLLKYFRLTRVSPDSPIVDSLCPVPRGHEEEAVWGSYIDYEQDNFKTIHHYIGNPIIYMDIPECSLFLNMFNSLSGDDSIQNINLILMDMDMYVKFLLEFTGWEQKVFNEGRSYNSIIHKIIDKDIKVDKSEYANPNEIILLDRESFEILIAAKDNQVVWNLISTYPKNNKKIVFKSNTENILTSV